MAVHCCMSRSNLWSKRAISYHLPRKRLRLRDFTGVLSTVCRVVHEMKLAKIEMRSVTKSITKTVFQYFWLVSW